MLCLIRRRENTMFKIREMMENQNGKQCISWTYISTPLYIVRLQLNPSLLSQTGHNYTHSFKILTTLLITAITSDNCHCQPLPSPITWHVDMCHSWFFYKFEFPSHNMCVHTGMPYIFLILFCASTCPCRIISLPWFTIIHNPAQMLTSPII